MRLRSHVHHGQWWKFTRFTIQTVARPSGTNLQLAAETWEFAQVPWLIWIDIVGQGSLYTMGKLSANNQFCAIHTADNTDGKVTIDRRLSADVHRFWKSPSFRPALPWRWVGTKIICLGLGLGLGLGLVIWATTPTSSLYVNPLRSRATHVSSHG